MTPNRKLLLIILVDLYVLAVCGSIIVSHLNQRSTENLTLSPGNTSYVFLQSLRSGSVTDVWLVIPPGGHYQIEDQTAVLIDNAGRKTTVSLFGPLTVNGQTITNTPVHLYRLADSTGRVIATLSIL